MSLSRLFWLISIALMLLFSVLTARIVFVEWGAYARGAGSTEAVRSLQLVMIAMEKVSFERGPSNALMGDHEQSPARQQQLAAARAQSDAALAGALAVLREESDARYIPALRKLERVSQALVPARERVDRQAGLAYGQRSSMAISQAVQGMVGLMPALISAVSDISAIAVQADPQLLDGLTGMRVAASLREYAGQLGSQFTAPVIIQRPLTKGEVIEIGKLYGRIQQLRSLLDLEMREYRDNTGYLTALSVLDQQYFGQGLPFLNDLVQTGLGNGIYGLDTATLAQRYVPTMSSILLLRDVIFADLMHQAEARNQQARNVLISAVAMALFAFLCFFGLMYVVRQRVLGPVLKATNIVVGLAEDKVDIEIPVARHADEVSSMLQALNVLKGRSVERISLASERETLIAQLRQSSNTDFLTGVLNRRAFFVQSESHIAIAQRYRRQLALILMDIDHFKQINDVHGHLAGDEVLRRVVGIAGKALRKMDLFARYGGEEFIILLPETDLDQGLMVAEKLRSELSVGEFSIEPGKTIAVTASFGVSALTDQETLDQLISRADEALYAAKSGGRNRVAAA
ncbi:diguanylate cyclase (GGDEF)-like protein [Herbaspirillum sp. Sphag1AN]|uniref:GGDEF domain-containing protein n=1 Tax=unclassified Herbaspirillum TaxID=2624150 RepID=UPI001615F8EC|nr:MULTISPECIES: GGDEF domain-containing protein [unclassified Herbaspirillum]MBB3211478.1 diguanylate cyclase (GGDEF)-like protein [Herbaspirillum sp. Sphag1AN]MBB3245256.1 diguanylate cyclase (GGDEF)-like protein [Herbaspirillum sp. Sphag64]